MSRINLWSGSLSRVELDQRSRDARLRLKQLERRSYRMLQCGGIGTFSPSASADTRAHSKSDASEGR